MSDEENIREENIEHIPTDYAETMNLDVDGMETGGKTDDFDLAQKQIVDFVFLANKAIYNPEKELGDLALLLPSLKKIPLKNIKNYDFLVDFVKFAASPNPKICAPALRILAYLLSQEPTEFGPILIDMGLPALIEDKLTPKQITNKETNEANVNLPDVCFESMLRLISDFTMFIPDYALNFIHFLHEMVHFKDPKIKIVAVYSLSKICLNFQHEDLIDIVRSFDWSIKDQEYIKRCIICITSLARSRIMDLDHTLFDIFMSLDIETHYLMILKCFLIFTSNSDESCRIIAEQIEHFAVFLNSPLPSLALMILLNVAGSPYYESINLIIPQINDLYLNSDYTTKQDALRVILQHFKTQNVVYDFSLFEEQMMDYIINAFSFQDNVLHMLALSILLHQEFYSDELVELVENLIDELDELNDADPEKDKEKLLAESYLAAAYRSKPKDEE